MARKGWKEELEAKTLGKISKDVLIRALNASDAEFPLIEKAKIASQIYCRMLPRDINLNADDGIKVIIENFQKVPESQEIQGEIEIGGSKDPELHPDGQATDSPLDA